MAGGSGEAAAFRNSGKEQQMCHPTRLKQKGAKDGVCRLRSERGSRCQREAKSPRGVRPFGTGGRREDSRLVPQTQDCQRRTPPLEANISAQGPAGLLTIFGMQTWSQLSLARACGTKPKRPGATSPTGPCPLPQKPLSSTSPLLPPQ